MVCASRVVVGIADSSMFDTRSLCVFALPHEIDRIITDSGTPSALVAALRAQGVIVDLV
jgi:DeoR family transcriptional regulator of aga operon